jgi:predicted nucleic acid-binding protein
MPSDAVVVDASALAALLFGEPSGPEVATRLEGGGLFAPILLRYELASLCLKKACEEPEKERQLRFTLDLLSALRIREVQIPTDGLVQLAQETRLTAYDAAYLWLARELQTQLVTLDVQLNRAGTKDE